MEIKGSEFLADIGEAGYVYPRDHVWKSRRVNGVYTNLDFLTPISCFLSVALQLCWITISSLRPPIVSWFKNTNQTTFADKKPLLN